MAKKVKCFVDFCSSDTGDPEVKFYHFPKPGVTNLDRCRIWAEFSKPQQEWTSAKELKKLHTSHQHICSAHFKKDAFRETDPTRLSNYSIPSIAPASSTYRRDVNTLHLLAPDVVSSEFSVPIITPKVIPQSSSLPLSVESVSSLSFLSTDTPSMPCEAIPTPLSSSIGPESNPNTFSPSFNTAPISTPFSSPVTVKPGPITLSSPAPPSTPSANTHSTPINIDPRSQRGVKRKRTARRSLLQQLNVTRINHLTPRKQMLVRSNRKKEKEVARMKRQYSILKEQSAAPNVMDLPVFKKLPHSLKLIIQSTIRCSSCKPNGRRWTLDDKLQALTLFKNSPRSYYLLRKLFPLPAPRTLRSLLSHLPYGTGVNKQVLNALNKSLEKFDIKDRFVSLMFDEMAIRKNLVYNPVTDKIDGFQDHAGQGCERKVANHALVFMVQGLRRKFKQPIAYYLSGGGTSNARLKVFLKETIRACEEAGLKVTVTVCDMGSNNVSTVKALGATPEKPYFELDGRRVYTIFDPCHLLKCTRNNFKEKNVSLTVGYKRKMYKGIAKWKHIRSVVYEDRQRVFQSLRHIKDSHLNPVGAKKMKVNLAAQIFSNSVASVIENQHTYGILKDDSSAMITAAFCKALDSLFDSLNGRGNIPYKGKILRKRVEENSPHHALYRKAEKFIRSWKFDKHSASNPPPSQVGWQFTLRAVQYIWKDLQKAGYRYMEPRSLNQDALENLFGVIRGNCGQNSNPTVSQFVGGFKTAILNNCTAAHSKGTNCQMDNVGLLDDLRVLLEKKKTIAKEESEVTDLLKDIDVVLGQTLAKSSQLKIAIKSGDNESRPIAHIAGFVAHKMLPKMDCTHCKNILLAEKIGPCHSLIAAKEYNDGKKSLKYCSEKFIESVGSSLYLSDALIQKYAHINNIRKTITCKLNEKVNFTWLKANCCSVEHAIEIIELMNDCIFFITVKWWCQRQNRAFIAEYLKKLQERKLNIQKGK